MRARTIAPPVIPRPLFFELLDAGVRLRELTAFTVWVDEGLEGPLIPLEGVPAWRIAWDEWAERPLRRRWWLFRTYALIDGPAWLRWVVNRV